MKKIGYILICMLLTANLLQITLTVQAFGVSSGDAVQTVSEGDSEQGTDIIKVVLPTEFAVLMYEENDGSGIHLESQDILFINKSEFPVAVKIKDISYEVTAKSSRTANGKGLNLRVKEYQKEEYVVPYVAGAFVPFDISLGGACMETNADMLLKSAEGWNPIGEVKSADYGILRLEGSIDDVNLREEDVKVGIVFELEKTQ